MLEPHSQHEAKVHAVTKDPKITTNIYSKMVSLSFSNPNLHYLLDYHKITTNLGLILKH